MLSTDSVGKHWILNLAATCPVPLWQLYPVVRAEILNVKEIPGFAAESYAAALGELLRDGMILISGTEGANPPDLQESMRTLRKLPVAPSWEMARMPGSEISFELTPRGGAAWESVAEPDWNHILIESSDLESVELFSPDQNQLMAWMGWYQQLHDQAIDLESVEVTRRENFAILYWKQLPVVYQASLRLKPRAAGLERARRLYSFAWFKDWAMRRWYRNPWDLPSWPG